MADKSGLKNYATLFVYGFFFVTLNEDTPSSSLISFINLETMEMQ
jgi:hypothetical protein